MEEVRNPYVLKAPNLQHQKTESPFQLKANARGQGWQLSGSALNKRQPFDLHTTMAKC